MKPSVEHLRTLGCKIWMGIPDKIRKCPDVKAKSVVLLRCLTYGKYPVLMDETRTVQVTRHCKIVEDQFPMKIWKNISRVDKDCIEAEEIVELTMEFEMVAQYLVSANGSPDEVSWKIC